MYDVVIIGKGPAGISASLYTKRANLSTCVIGKDGGALEKADKIENYFGLKELMSGKELIEAGIMQAENLEIKIITDEVLNIVWENSFKITTRKHTLEAKALILATGATRAKPKIQGIDQYEGKGISYCAVCDAFFYRGKDVAVLGNGNYAIHEIQELLPIAKSVTMLTNGKDAPEYRNEELKVEKKAIREFRGDSRIQNIVFEDESTLPVEGIFIAEGIASSVDFARKLGATIQDNHIIVNDKMETTVPGLYAAGDCTGGLLQVSKAVYEGAKAGTEVIKWIRKGVT